MLFNEKDNSLCIQKDDFIIIKNKLELLMGKSLPEDIDLCSLQIPLLIPFMDLIEEQGFDINNISNIVFGVDDAVMGGAILYHFKRYSDFCNKGK